MPIFEKAWLGSIAFVTLGGAAYRIYWRNSWFRTWPNTTEEWTEREELVSKLIDSVNRLMIGCAYFEKDKTTNSLLCIEVGSARLLAAFYSKAVSRMRSSFSSRVQAKLNESFCNFTAIFEKLKIHPYMQLLIGEASSSKTSLELHNMILVADLVAEGERKGTPVMNASSTAMLALKSLGSASSEDIKRLIEECESLLKVLDPKKLRWISVEEIKWHSGL